MIWLAMFFAAAALFAPADPQPETLRLDYYHTGNATEERFALEELVAEGPWPGRTSCNLDETNLGKYFFQVVDRQTQRTLFSRGFASIYGEWETTDEAKQATRTFHESLRFPAPSGPFQILLKKRDRENAFREIWSLALDPKGPSVIRAAATPAKSGPSRRTAIRRTRWTFCSWGTGTPRRKWTNGTRTPQRWPTSFSRLRPSGSADRISTSGPSIHLRNSPAYPARRMACTGVRPFARPTTHSAASVTCSRSTTNGSGKRQRRRPMNSLKSS